jgi:hypothetical protein
VTWTGVCVDQSGSALGELREASGRSFRKALSRSRTMSWTVQADNPLARWHVDDTVRVKWYQDDVLRLVGPLATFEKNRDQSGGTIAVNCADPFTMTLPRRLLGKSPQGSSYGTALAQIDKGAIVTQMLAEANASGDTGIRIGNVQPSANGFAGPYYYAPSDQAISALAAGTPGFDWDLVPIEPTADSTGVQIGRLDIYAAMGGTKDNVSFEFGVGKRNVQSFRDVGDNTQILNRAYGLPPGFPDNATSPVLTSIDQTSINARGPMEGTVDTGDLAVDALRQALLDENVAVRKAPRRLIAFQPIAQDPANTPDALRRTPRPFVDYDVGDVVHFRADEPFRRVDPSTGAVLDTVMITTVDALFRVFAIQVDIADNGSETVTVTLVANG